jgi:hypothetical protein
LKEIDMLTIFQRNGSKYCDGVSRRSFLRIGAMGIAGLTLVDLMRLEAAAGVASSNKALINIFLGGGPSHTDMFDLKPDAPSEFRGEFSPIKTNVSGIEICELMPRLAKMADKYSLIRSIVGTYGDHSSYHTQSGWSKEDLKQVGGRPALGSVVSKVQNGKGEAPAFVSLKGELSPGFLGPIYAPYQPDSSSRSMLSLSRISADRLKDRSKLLSQLDDLKRDIDSSGAMEAMDSFQQRAVDVVTSGRLADALDIDKERPDIRSRYAGPEGRRGDSENLLLARRLIEAGVRVVSTQWGGWDTHSDNFRTLRNQVPSLDCGLSALIGDLYDRGMDKDVTVIMWGEFGRTPRVNAAAGRDHWPRVMQALVAGGGMKSGQVIGATDRLGGEAVDRPVHLRDVFATLYQNVGIDTKRVQLTDPAGRPQYLVEGHEPVRELV